MIPILRAEFSSSRAAFEQARFGPKLRWLKDSVVGDLGDTLWLLMGTIGLLLVIACANVANLVLVRTETRRPELAIRTALGAGWAAVARVVFAESAILGLAGGVAGVAVAYLSLPLLLSLGATDLPQIMTVTIDRTVLLVALGTSVLATLTFALIPVFRFAQPKLQVADALRGGTRMISDATGHRRRHLLVVLQVALALVLLIGSGLMIRTFLSLRQVDPGFRDPAHVQTFQLTIPAAAVPNPERAETHDPEQTIRLQHAIVDRLAGVAGVESVGFSSSNDGLPLDGDGRTGTIFVEGRNAAEGVISLKEIQFVSPRFFDTLLTPVRAGRAFDWNDVYQNARVALVSENLARAEWGSAGTALGKRISPGRSGPWSEVVGVVKDVHHDGLSQPAPQTVIFPAVAGNTTASFVIHSERVGTTGFLEELRRAVTSVNANLSLASVQTMGDLYNHALARTSMTVQLLVITGTIALLLGLVGIYGVVSYAIAQRRREIGVRLALGAGQDEVRRMFVRHALVLVGIGVAIGLGAAVALTQLMQSQLFGVSPLDPLTHLSVAVGLVTTAGLASYFSAWQASALDPIEALKGE